MFAGSKVSVLLVEDNVKCGGANVSFSGTYRKRR